MPPAFFTTNPFTTLELLPLSPMPGSHTQWCLLPLFVNHEVRFITNISLGSLLQAEDVNIPMETIT